MERKSLTDLEIKEQYKNGFVQLEPMLENLIVKFKNDKTSVDIQQLQLIISYLIAERDFDENYIDELEEENKYLKGQIPTDKIFYYSYKDFIPKSKIKEKIEEVDKYGDCEIGSPPLYKTKKGVEILKEDAELILQELLEEQEE